MSDNIVRLCPELAAAYPNAKRAILLVDGFEIPQWWPTLRKVAEESGIDTVIQVLRNTCGARKYQGDLFIAVAREEFLTADFRKYLMAMLGMM